MANTKNNNKKPKERTNKENKKNASKALNRSKSGIVSAKKKAASTRKNMPKNMKILSVGLFLTPIL